MKNIIYICSLLGILLLINACTEDVGTLEGGTKPIVEAYLVPDHPISMTITKEIPYNSDDTTTTQVPVNGLAITVTGNGETYKLTSVGEGVYKSEASVRLKVGATYSMSFVYEGKTVSASTIIPTKPTDFAEDITSLYRTKVDLSAGGTPGAIGGGFDNTQITLTWTNPKDEYHFVVANNTETDPVLIVTLPTDVSNDVLIRRFRTEPVQGVTTFLRANQFLYFGNHDIILMKVNPDYAALYKSTGSTSQNISTPPSTITNGLGLFTGINADTLKFEVKQR